MSSQPLPVELEQISPGIIHQQQPTPTHMVPPHTAQQQPDMVVYQELPASTEPIKHDPPSFGGFNKSPHPQDVIRSDTFPSVVGSDEYPTPVSSPAPYLSHTPAPRYSVAMGQSGYYGPDGKTPTGAYYAHTDEKFVATGGVGVGVAGEGAVQPHTPLMNPGPVYYPQGTLLHQQTYDPENAVVPHAGVVDISQKSPKQRVNCCGTEYAKKTVIILSSVAALLLIVAIGVGAGLGAQHTSNRRNNFYYI